MRLANIFLLLFSLTLAIAGCSGPGVIDVDDPTPTERDSDTTITNPDTTIADTAATDSDTVKYISVAEVQSLYDEDDIQYVIVCGYVVGTVKSSMNTGCSFAAPFSVESNILLADDPAPQSPEDCLPVELKKGGAARDSLNLVGNPQVLGKRVIILAALQRYFRVAGLKSVLDFQIVE